MITLYNFIRRDKIGHLFDYDVTKQNKKCLKLNDLFGTIRPLNFIFLKSITIFTFVFDSS